MSHPAPHTIAHHRGQWVLCAVLILVGSCDSGLGIGHTCAGTAECRADLQCLNDVCVPRCVADVECGDGFICDSVGTCAQAPLSLGDDCSRERDCGPHLTCKLEEEDLDDDGFLEGKTCAQENPIGGGTIGNACDEPGDCRNGICQAGLCTHLCLEDEDCPAPFTCAVLQKTETLFFLGCFSRR